MKVQLPTLSLRDRVAAFAHAYASTPAAWPWLTTEDGRDVLYGVWVVGQDYRNKAAYYGTYPPRFLDHVMALFPDVEGQDILHVFSGALPPGDYTRVDVNPLLKPDVVGDVYDVATLFPDRKFFLQIADPPYSDDDAVNYGTVMVDRYRVTQALAAVAPVGGYLAWLDCVWPMHTKTQWVTVGRIYLQRATNHRVRVLSLFQ